MSLALPYAKVTVQEGGLGLVATPSEDVHLVMGCSSKGTTLSSFGVTTIERLKADYGCGPAVKSAAYSIGKTAASVVFCRLPSVARAAQINGLTISGAQTVTLTGTPTDGYDVSIVCTDAGTVGGSAPKFKWSKDGGETYTAPATLSGTTLALTGTGLTANFTDTNTFAANDSIIAWTVPAAESLGPVTTTRANPGSPSTSAITFSGTPQDDYEIVWIVDVGGTIGTAGIAYRYSLDGGRSYSTKRSLGTATSVALNDGDEASGVTVELGAGTLVTNDTATGNAFGPTWSAANALTAIDNLLNTTLSWRFAHFVGWKSKADIASVASKLADIAAGGAAKHTFGLFSARPRGSFEKESNWESRLIAEFATLADVRTGCGAGRARITCPVTGRQDRRTCLLPIVARLVSKTLQVDPGRRLDGPLGSDVDLYDTKAQRVEHDARLSEVLHGARFLTLRTYADRAGVFCTRGNLMSAENSDFNRIANRAVMDLAATVFHAVMLEQLENHLAVNPAVGGAPGATPGALREPDCRKIDREIESALEARLVSHGFVSAVQVRVSRTDPFLSTGKLSAKVRVTPLGYVDGFDGDIAFINPAFAAFQVA